MSYFNIESGVLCTLGILTNSINAAVFMHPKMKDISFRYLLAISLSEILYLGFESMKFINIYDYIGLLHFSLKEYNFDMSSQNRHFFSHHL